MSRKTKKSEMAKIIKEEKITFEIKRKVTKEKKEDETKRTEKLHLMRKFKKNGSKA